MNQTQVSRKLGQDNLAAIVREVSAPGSVKFVVGGLEWASLEFSGESSDVQKALHQVLEKRIGFQVRWDLHSFTIFTPWSAS